MTKLTFEQCLDYIGNESGHKFLDWQKEFLRTIYDYPKLYIAPTRQDGIIAILEAEKTLNKLLGVNEIDGNEIIEYINNYGLQ